MRDSLPALHRIRHRHFLRTAADQAYGPNRERAVKLAMRFVQVGRPPTTRGWPCCMHVLFSFYTGTCTPLSGMGDVGAHHLLIISCTCVSWPVFGEP